MTRTLIIAASLLFVSAAAKAQNYTFSGYEKCPRANNSGCYHWTKPPYAWVEFVHTNILTKAECLNAEIESRALTGLGFCYPPVQ